MLFGRGRVKELEQNLRTSFEKVRQDTSNLHKWVSYLNRRDHELASENDELRDSVAGLKSEVTSLQEDNVELEQEVASLRSTVASLRQKLAELPPQLTREDVREIVDSYYDFEPLMERLAAVTERLSRLERRRTPPGAERAALKEKIARRVTTRSKEYLKSVIKGIIQKYGKISAVQIREMVVEEQGLCSKSSFYRILEELEKEQDIGVSVGKKEKVYFAKGKRESRI